MKNLIATDVAIAGSGTAATALLGQLVEQRFAPRSVTCIGPHGPGFSESFALGPDHSNTNTNSGLNSLCDDDRHFAD